MSESPTGFASLRFRQQKAWFLPRALPAASRTDAGELEARHRRATPARGDLSAPVEWSRSTRNTPATETSSGMELLAEHARGGFAPRPGHRPSAERAVNVHAAVGDHFGAGADRAR